MSLSKCIGEYWALGIVGALSAPIPCILQMVRKEPISFQANGVLNWGMHLSDGVNILSNFLYRPKKHDYKAFVPTNSVIKIWSTKFAPYKGVYYHYFDDFDKILGFITYSATFLN